MMVLDTIVDDVIVFVVVVRLVAANRRTGVCKNRILKTIKKKIEQFR